MNTTRRGFVGTIAPGTAAGVVAGTSLINRKASAQTRAAPQSGVYDDGIIQLHQNESARGPGPNTMEALRSNITKRVGRGYKADYVEELQAAIARNYNVSIENVELATGSSPLLRAGVRAYCSADRKFVTPMPTYSTSLATAQEIGAATQELPLDGKLSIDLDGLADAAPGAGLL